MLQAEANKPEATSEDTMAPPTSSNLDLLDYLLIIAKHKKMIIRNTIIAAVLAVLYSLTLTKTYTAKTMIIPGDVDKGGLGAALTAQMGGLANLAGGALGGKSTGDMYVTMLKSETIKDAVIDKFKLMDVYKIRLRSVAYKKLDKMLKINLGKKDGVITLTVDDRDPKRAADIANAHVEELGKLAAGLNMASAGENRKFFEKRIIETKNDLNHAAEALKQFQIKNKTISVSDQAKSTFAQIARLRGQLALKEVELAALQSQFTDSSQEVQTLKSIIANLKKQVAGLEGIGATSSIPTVGNMPELGNEYLRLMRQVKVQEAVYEMLTKQYELSTLNESKDIAPIQIIQKANVPDWKSKPSRAKVTIKFTFLVLLGSIAYVVARENYMKMNESERNRIKTLIDEIILVRKNYN